MVPNQTQVAAPAITPKPVTFVPMTIKSLLGDVVFKRPQRAFTTKDGKSSMVARLLVPISSLLTIEMTAWCRSKEVEGGYIEQEYTVALPRGFTLNDDNPLAMDQMEDWKNNLLSIDGPLDQFLFNGKAATMSTAGTVARLVKRVKIGEQTASN